MSEIQHWTPLRWWSDMDLADLSRGLNSALNGWAKGWFADAEEFFADTRCKVAHEADVRAVADWRLIGKSTGAAAWILLPDRAREGLHFALFASGEGTIATEIANTACLEFEEALRSFLHLLPQATDEFPPIQMFHHWDGAVLAELSWPGAQRCLLLMNSECVARLPRTSVRTKASPSRPHELVSCEVALASAKVSLRVELDPCELEIGHLAVLQPGDVIPWPHALEHPLNVNLGDNTRICSGHLGRVDSSKAVELFA